MSGRNWMMRRMLIDAIRKDPQWKNGDYTTQPTAIRHAVAYFGMVSIGGAQALYRQAPTREAADRIVDQRLAQPFTADANDFLYQWESSADYNPSPELERIDAALLAINSADDERNPPELGVMERELARVRLGKLYLIPASGDTRGHGTTGMAKFWKQQLADLLQVAPRLAK
jgi:homoserine O-acetyltransferase